MPAGDPGSRSIAWTKTTSTMQLSQGPNGSSRTETTTVSVPGANASHESSSATQPECPLDFETAYLT